jgi:cell division protein FtsL
MTVVQPNKNRGILSIVIILGAFLFLAVYMNISIYSRTVSLKHDVVRLEKEMEDLRVQNAELKGSFYQLVDSKKLNDLADEKGLIQDKNPQWVFASRL